MSAAELAAIAAAAAPGVALIAGGVSGRLAPVTTGERLAPALDTCAASGCRRPVPRGRAWCSALCRHLDDPRDSDDNLWGDDDA